MWALRVLVLIAVLAFTGHSFKVGEKVTWVGARQEVGSILGYKDDGKVRVSFPNGTYIFDESDLDKYVPPPPPPNVTQKNGSNVTNSTNMSLANQTVNPVPAVKKYDACEGLEDGDRCNVCSPTDPVCVEESSPTYCWRGNCSDKGATVGPAPLKPYEPCEGKNNAEPCTLCAPGNRSCTETPYNKTCWSGSCGYSIPLLTREDNLVDYYDILGTLKFELSFETQWSDAFNVPFIEAMSRVAEVNESRVSITSVTPVGEEWVAVAYTVLARLTVRPVEEVLLEQCTVAEKLANGASNGAIRVALKRAGFPAAYMQVFKPTVVNVLSAGAVHRTDLLEQASHLLTTSAQEKVDSYCAADAHTRSELNVAFGIMSTFADQGTTELRRLNAAIDDAASQQSRLELQIASHTKAKDDLVLEQERSKQAFTDVKSNANKALEQLTDDMDQAVHMSQQMSEVFTTVQDSKLSGATAATIMQAVQKALDHVAQCQDKENDFVEAIGRIDDLYQSALASQISIVNQMIAGYQAQATKAGTRVMKLTSQKATVLSSQTDAQRLMDSDVAMMGRASALFVREHENLILSSDQAFMVHDYIKAMRYQVTLDVV